MTTEEKGALIGAIISNLRFAASQHSPPRPFCAGQTFLALAFKTDDELKHIAKMIGI